MPFPLAVYLIYFAVGLPSLAVQAVALLASKIRIEEVGIFYGEPLASWDLGNTRLKLSWIPFGCSTKHDINQFALLPTSARVGLILIPSVVLLGTALLLLGPEAGWHHFVTGFRQMIEGVLRPQAVGYALLGKLHGLYQQSPMAVAGVFSAKMAAWSLLPIAHVGGPVLLQIFSPTLRPREAVEKWVTMGMLMGFVISLVWMGIFLVYAVKHWT